jgi:hypothetical protein
MPTMRNWSGNWDTISRVWVPIDPVEPRRVIAFTVCYCDTPPISYGEEGTGNREQDLLEKVAGIEIGIGRIMRKCHQKNELQS